MAFATHFQWRHVLRAFAAIVALLTLSFATADVDALAADYRIENGWFFSQTGGDTEDPRDGFTVTDDDSVRFWTAFNNFGGIQTVGYPVTQRFTWDGFTTQVFQKVAFQWRPETQTAAFINVFDDLNARGFDKALEGKLIPRQEEFDEQDLEFSTIQSRRIALLDAEPAFREQFHSVSDPVLWYGLPQSEVREFGDGLLRTIRLQRAVFQLWTRDVPWAKAGTVTVANGGDEAKSLGLWPATATSPLPAAPLPPPPPELGLSDFYMKHLDAAGIPVVSSATVRDEALFRAAGIAQEMLAHRPDLLPSIIGAGASIAVIANLERLTEIPEYSNLYVQFPGVDWDVRAGGGLGATTFIPVTSARENNLLCDADDPYQNNDVLVHEFGHSILNLGIRLMPDGEEFVARLQTAYEQSTGSGLWRFTYAGTNIEEYWAEGVQSWFNLNGPPNSDQNDINTRSELLEYDPGLSSLLREVFGDTQISSSCQQLDDSASILVEGNVIGPDGKPDPTVEIWAFDRTRSYFGSSFPSRFALRLPPGRYTLGVNSATDPDCGSVGFYGPGGFVARHANASTILVEDDPIDGIEIKLPASIGELCEGG